MRNFINYLVGACLLAILLGVTVAVIAMAVNAIQPAPTCPKPITPAIIV